MLKNLNPNKLAYFFAIFFLLFWLVIAFPMSNVFSGDWVLKQNVDIVDIESIQTPAIPALNITNIEIPIGIASIRFYSICISIGVLFGYLLTIYLAKFNLVVSTVIDRLFIGLMFFGFIGARLFYVVFNWDQFYSSESWQNTILDIIIGVNQGGLAIFGGMIGAGLYLWYYTSRFHFNVYEFLDFIVPGLLLGQIFGRFGNFFNYEAYGQPTKVFWKMFVPPTARLTEQLQNEFYHPTFLYEIIPNMILLVIILYNYSAMTKKNSGLVLAFYCIGYGVIRFFTEIFRSDALLVNIPDFKLFGIFEIENLLVSQISAFLLICFGIYILIKRRKVLYLKREMTEIKYG